MHESRELDRFGGLLGSAASRRILFIGLLLSLAVAGLGVADYYRLESDLGQARADWVFIQHTAWECQSSECGKRPPVIVSEWRAQRMVFGFGVIAIGALTIFLATTRQPRRPIDLAPN